MSLLTVAQLRDLVASDLDDDALQEIIDREEAEIVAQYGDDGDGATAISEVCDGGGCSIYTKRRISSISSITEAQTLGGSPSTLSSTDYYVFGKQGRIVRLVEGVRWGRIVTVSYIPEDDRALRRQIIVELCRLALEQTALQSESVGGEYSATAPADWEQRRKAIIRRAGLPNI